MSLRLIEMVLPEEQVQEAKDLLTQHQVVDVWYDRISETQTLVKVLVDAEQSEALIDDLGNDFSEVEGFRLIILPVAASIPRVEAETENEKKEADPATSEEAKRQAERVNREELYTNISDTIKFSRVYYVMVVLSTMVAAVGLLQDSTPVIIGAMVIAPLLGPNVALALATTLGDVKLAKKSLVVNFTGIGTALGFAVILGAILPVDPTMPEISARTSINLGDVALGLAAGSAGCLAFTKGVSTALVGVMVAVALLPPTTVTGLLIGSGYYPLALLAFVIVLTNIICINLSGVITFWFQGIQPMSWWEANIARRATRISVITCGVLLTILILVLIFSKKLLKLYYLL